MEKIDAVWFVEHIARELDVACIVSYVLKEKFGYEIEILPYDIRNYLKIVKKYSPALVIIPYCYSENDSCLKNFLPYWNKSVFFNLSWEELYYKAYSEYKAPKGYFVQKEVIHHAWSQNFKNYLVKHGVPATHI